MESEPLETFSFLDTSIRSIPYNEAMCQFRLFAKWIVAAYLIVMVVLPILIFKEQDLAKLLFKSVPVVICLGWLYRTRSHQEFVQVPITISFYPEEFTLSRPDTLSCGLRGDVRMGEFYRVRYETVTRLHYDVAYHRVSIHGRIESSFFHWTDGTLDAHPFQTKDTNGAISYWTDHLSPEEDEGLLAALVKYTGKEVVRYGTKRSKPVE